MYYSILNIGSQINYFFFLQPALRGALNKNECQISPRAFYLPFFSSQKKKNSSTMSPPPVGPYGYSSSVNHPGD